MNLQEFLNYRQNCPFCNTSLTTYFHSSKKQSIKWEDGRMVIIFPMYSTDKKKSSDYKVGYSFSVINNNFHIEFYSKDEQRIEKEIPLHLIKRFKSYNTNLNPFRFFRQCDSCRKYDYSSNEFKLNFRHNCFIHNGKLKVYSESFYLIQVMEPENKKSYRVYRLLNFYGAFNCQDNYYNEATHLMWWDDFSPEILRVSSLPRDTKFLILPLIYFTSSEETLARIRKLLVFS